MHNITCYVAMNEDGDFEVGTDPEEASTRLMESMGAQMIRVVEINLRMVAPEVSTVSTDVPDEAGKTVEAQAS